MQHLIDDLSLLFKQWSGKEPSQVDVLPLSGSDRRYFRLFGERNQTVIGTYGINVTENETFFYFTQHFRDKKLNVPELYAISDDRNFYLQEDLGDTSLLNILEEKGSTGEVYLLFRDSLHQLA